MKTNKKRTILILGLCLFAVAAIICAVLLLGGNTGVSPDNEVLDQGSVPPSQTPLAEENDVVQEPAVTDEPQPAKEDKVYIRVYTTYRELGRAIEKYALENGISTLRFRPGMTQYARYNDIINMVDDNLKNNAEPMEVFCVPAPYAPSTSGVSIPNMSALTKSWESMLTRFLKRWIFHGTSLMPEPTRKARSLRFPFYPTQMSLCIGVLWPGRFWNR